MAGKEVFFFVAFVFHFTFIFRGCFPSLVGVDSMFVFSAWESMSICFCVVGFVLA